MISHKDGVYVVSIDALRVLQPIPTAETFAPVRGVVMPIFWSFADHTAGRPVDMAAPEAGTGAGAGGVAADRPAGLDPAH